MEDNKKTREELLAEVKELKLKLLESEETLNAIQSGEIDAIVVSGSDGDQIYSLEGADQAYRTLIEEMNEGAAILTHDRAIFYCNNRLADMVKVPLEEMMGNSLDNFISLKDRWIYEALVKKGLESNNSSGEISLKISDGTYLPAYISMKSLRIKDLNGICLNVTDLTEQKRNEEIIASERLSRCIFEQAGESIIVCDENGFITRASNISHSLCECNPILEYFNNVFHLFDENMKIFSIYPVLKGKSIRQMEIFLQKSDGNKIYLLLSARPVYNHKKELIGCVIILTDINERKNSEKEIKKLLGDTQRFAEELEVSNEELQSTTEELQVANEELRKTHDTLEEKVQERTKELYNERQRLFDVLETLPVMICLLSPDYHVKFANRAFREMFGESHARLCYEYRFGFKEPCEFCESFKPLETGEPHFWQVNSPNGKIIDAYDFPFTDIDGSKLILEMDIEVTEQKLNEKELKNTLEELKRSNEELQSFAYITSHDLQEPLRTMGNYAGLLKHRYGGQLDEDADDFLGYMESGAARMKDMVQGLLDYSRVGTRGDEFKVFNSEDALDHALINLRSAIEECHAEITHDPLPEVVADESQIRRVFQNLIGNALKFRKKGVPPKIHISARKEGNEHVFSVSDNGIGIEEEYTNRIFEVFKRLHAIGEYQGAGIGLAIVKRIIDRHGGHIWVESELGNGSTFYFTLPYGD